MVDQLARRLCDNLLVQAGLPADRKAAALGKADRGRLVQSVKRFRLPVQGTLGFEKAEVTAGGISGSPLDTLGWILVTSGNAAQGMPLLRQAAAQAGSDPRIMYHFAVALRDTGKREEAITVLNGVVANKAEFTEKVEAQKLLDELNKG